MLEPREIFAKAIKENRAVNHSSKHILCVNFQPAGVRENTAFGRVRQHSLGREANTAGSTHETSPNGNKATVDRRTASERHPLRAIADTMRKYPLALDVKSRRAPTAKKAIPTVR